MHVAGNDTFQYTQISGLYCVEVPEVPRVKMPRVEI
jgi:hypothetical protein